MAKKEFHVVIDGKLELVPQGTTYEEIAKRYADKFDSPIVLARFSGRLRELFKKVARDGELEFVTMSEKPGIMTYRRSMVLLMQKAFRSLENTEATTIHVLYTMDNAYYCELFRGNEMVPVTPETIEELDKKMRSLVEEDIPLMKRSAHLESAMNVFTQNNLPDKKRLFEYRRVANVNMYNLDGYEDYFYGYMVPHTGMLNLFEIEQYNNGFFLNMPSQFHPNSVESVKFRPKLFTQLYEASKWAFDMDMATLGALNDRIVAGEMNDMILAQEAVQEREIAKIAKQIVESGDKKFVIIAGPSSSGKTTFSHRLSIQLYAQGYHPHPIALDDFFVNREDMIPQPDGTLDFEDISAVDVEGFNDKMERLLAGEEVKMPTFDFIEGRQEYRGNKLKLGNNDILVIEGIHGLNPKMTYKLDDKNKFRIYISALTPLKIDEHNCLSTRDGRLIRRMVRDNRSRGNNAHITLSRWDSVERGEERHIFPFQENADVMFNSALIYEISVLKPYVEPLLFAVPKDSPEYGEAKRLLKFLDYCLPYPSETVAGNSILREFIGGSLFNV
ncbi:MAG: nucleoside kinase [Eubacterium sp.]|nr:nucleoside kinase [Eubacterium sp.]